MTSFSLDPSVLPSVPERKGTLNLRSNHMKFGRATLNSHWHAAREAEPKDYDVTDSNEKRDLLKATYCRIGSCDEGFPETTTSRGNE
ncbi:Protein C9orf135 homolog [Geodia barretti]|uniref:Protein C9orf135 homolog n=1 Tax=Geodia barretti TaxID=519541 RepID=A0AA35X5X4_GEOBA|nr:Protein C9orf135 homolog [Geodia barretti]